VSEATLLTLKRGDTVVILSEETIPSDGVDWVSVTYQGITGYVSDEFLIQTSKLSEERGTTTATVHLRKEPNANSASLMKVFRGSSVEILGQDSQWTHVQYNGITGYIFSSYLSFGNEAPAVSTTTIGGIIKGALQRTYYASGTTTSAKDLEVGKAALEAMNPTSQERALVEWGLQYLGCPYRSGAAGPSAFDCSGFTSFVYKSLGYSIPRTAVSQYQAKTREILNVNELRPGDLIFFQDPAVSPNIVTHVGMYIGNGLFIHAGSGSTGSGKMVKVSDFSGGYYYKVLYSAKRVI
jgi:cell wall-associated NlpC family hydrolase